MGKFLHRFGLIAFKNPWYIIVTWAVLLVVGGALAMHFMRPMSSEITIPGTEAQKALDQMSELFPDSGKSSGEIVFAAKNGHKITSKQTEINRLISAVSKVDGVESATTPFTSAENFISKDGTIAYAPVQLKNEVGQIATATTDKVADLVSAARSDDLQIEIGGALIQQMPSDILGPGEIGGVILALVVLVITFGSLLASGMPIIVALVGIGVSTTLLFALSPLISINTTTPVLGVMLGLAVGIDYSLFIVNKYRQLLMGGVKPYDAAGRALATAGNAVVFAAATVIIALAALSVIGIPFMALMGLAGAGSVAFAALAALTILPAFFGLAGDKVLTRRMRRKIKVTVSGSTHKAQESTFWLKHGQNLIKHPWIALIGGVVVLAAIALPLRDLTLGLPSDQFQPKDTTERRAFDLVKTGFGAGHNGSLLVVVKDLPKVNQDDVATVYQQIDAEFQKQLAEKQKEQTAYFEELARQAVTPQQQMALQQQIQTAKEQGAKQIAAQQQKNHELAKQNAKYVQLTKIANQIGALDDVAKSLPAQVLDDGTAGIVQVIPSSAPSDQATKDLITKLRSDDTRKQVTSDNGATLAVSGVTALQGDINAKLAAALPIYLAIVIGLSFIILVIAFRSILIPLKATLGFLFSVGAMFGAMVIVFQYGWFGIAEAPGPIVSFIPIIAIGVLFGLAMDYEFFLVSSMHEVHERTKNAEQAVVHGFASGARVVVAAAVIMVSVFAGFIFNGDAIIQTIGFGLAFGVFVDAFIVRMTIVPAVMKLLGNSAYWLPKWLDKILPHVSIEGEDD